MQEMGKYANYVILFAKALLKTWFTIINLWQTLYLLVMLMLNLAITSPPENDQMLSIDISIAAKAG